MRIVHLDGSSGVAGDMWLGALVDAGGSLEAVQAAVEALGVGDVRITMGRVRRAGVEATSVRVRAPQETPPVRTWEQIRNILRFAALDDEVARRSLAVLERIAQAESAVHDAPVDELEFHEVGALDTIAEAVGTCAALRSLGVDLVTCGSIAIGSGTAQTPHGPVELPDPTVVALLDGFPRHDGPAGTEITTAAGAALLAELARPVAETPALTVERVGVGAGAADLPQPYVLRASVGTTSRDDIP